MRARRCTLPTRSQTMTFTWPLDGPPAMSLRDQWRMSLEDAARFKPEMLWFMGSDARLTLRRDLRTLVYSAMTESFA